MNQVLLELGNKRICSIIEFRTFFSQGLDGKSQWNAWELKVTNGEERESEHKIDWRRSECLENREESHWEDEGEV